MTDKSGAEYLEPMRSADPEVQKIIKEVLQLEQDKLYQDKPRLLSEIVEIIKRNVS